jgi:hypothetical protein
MPTAYEIKVKAATLDALKANRDKVRARLGNNRIGEKLQRLDTASADALANELLSLLDAIESVVGRARAVD